MKKHRQIRSRISYFPGMLSLLVLPLLFAWYYLSERPFKRAAVIEIVLPPLQLSHFDSLSYGPDYFQKPKRNYTFIHLNGHEQQDQLKLDFAQLAIRELLSSGDTITGVALHFSKSSKYWTLTRALDIMSIEEVPVYTIKDDHLWVYNHAPKPVTLSTDSSVVNESPITMYSCGLAYSKSKFPQPEKEAPPIISSFLQARALSAIPASLLFGLLLALSIKRLKQQSQPR